MSFVLHGWMTLNGSLKVKMGAFGAGTIGHGLLMVAVETVDGGRCGWLIYMQSFSLKKVQK